VAAVAVVDSANSCKNKTQVAAVAVVLNKNLRGLLWFC
jgi:hypothetical protein